MKGKGARRISGGFLTMKLLEEFETRPFRARRVSKDNDLSFHGAERHGAQVPEGLSDDERES
ncbi:MAG TPA: hypothetical protein VFN77_00995 [Acetobacteraceae bacterium]|nr:hypothetical protein [Acetobacteraceae bacterium]